jgi:tRNA G26 N,N-dimethylase Trm1
VTPASQTEEKCDVCGEVHGPGWHGGHTHPKMRNELLKAINTVAAANDRKHATVLQQLHETGKKLMELGESLTKIQL